ncbi:MAG TPA: protein kinase [Streptosporangiaceae bacterium]|nr:protein kinase [Streptosporangiaceae bacterium]
MPADPPRFPEGTALHDRYTPIEEIGAGGLGRVWRAYDRDLDRMVAIKELTPSAALPAVERDSLYARLMREARATARLHHPNVVGLYDILSDDERLWIVMQYVPGRSLQDVISHEGRISFRSAARIGSQLLDALSAAHRAGILHRDVKPSNVLITEEGQAVLSDFGIATIEGDSRLTQAGMIIGTPSYIAPERAQGEQATPASDLWSLGATLYAAVEGHPPFQRSDAMASLAAVLTEPVPSPANAGPLAPVLAGLLERDPARRMSAEEAARRLAAIADGAGFEPPLPNRSKSPYDTDPGFDAPSFPDVEEPPPATPAALGSAGPPLPQGSAGPPPAWRGLDETRTVERPLPPASMPAEPNLAGGGSPQPPPPPPAPPSPAPPSPAPPAPRPQGPDSSVTENIPLPRSAAPSRVGRRRWVVRGLFRRLRRLVRRPAPARPAAGRQLWADGSRADHLADSSSALYSPLRESFRYVHEPLPVDEPAIPLLGNERLIRELKERLTNSYGGTFLIAGFRGVGKTTLIERALAELAAERPHGRRVVPVVLSVARPMATERLLFAIVRRVFEELTEAGVLEALPPATRQSLLLAYMRTSLSFKETRSDAWERAANVEMDPAKLGGGVLKPLGLTIPKAGISTKRSRSLATEAAFLAYSETDVEHDMMRIVRMLTSAAAQRPRGRRRLVRRRRRAPFELKLVVVLDEMDKLTALRDGLVEVERLLGGLKNVVTMRGAHYIVVAGPDLHDHVLMDSGRGNSIYESIFAWRLYVPCSWTAPTRLLEHVLLNPPDGQANGIIHEFERYLRFKSRGIPRRLLQELNSFVVWEDAGKPYLRIGSQSYEAISFYALIERSLDDFFVATAREVLPTPIDQDRWRLGAYYLMDWILRSEGRPFTLADVTQRAEGGEFDPVLRVGRVGVEMLLEHLAGQQILDVLRRPAPETATYIEDVAGAQLPSYKLTDVLLAKLLGIVVHDEEERAELDYSGTVLAAGMKAGAMPLQSIGRRYELLRLIGEGGTSSVYEGRDVLLRRPVAIKMLRSSLSVDQRARVRFLREARIAAGVHHPNVVDVYEVVTLDGRAEDDDARFAIVMEYLASPTLQQLIDNGGPLPARRVALAATALAGALEYLADKGLARLDLKPHNIVMIPERGPVIIDLGIAKIVKNSQIWLLDSDIPEDQDPVTRTGVIIGTPAYLSPEQIRSNDVDIRSDIYALGLVMYTCLAGRHPYEGMEFPAMLAAMTKELDTAKLPGSSELRAVIARATARDPAQRYQSPAELLAALRDIPDVREEA